MCHEEEFRSVPHATRGKRSIETQAKKQVVSCQSVKTNTISVVLRAAEDGLVVLSLMLFISKPMLRYETYTCRHCSVS